MTTTRTAVLLSALFLAAAPAARAEAPAGSTAESQASGKEPEPRFGTKGPTTGNLGEGEIKVPEQYTFLSASETSSILKAQGNSLTGHERGAISPLSEKDGWMLYFSFEPIGYVKDDEKDAIDADAILDNYKEGAEAQNAEQPNQPPISVVGWREKPNYNSATHNLEWCIEAKIGNRPLLNHNIKVLGRRGVMEAVLACDPQDLDKALAQTRTLLGGYSFKAGGKYEEWTTGDKVAAVGLTGLVAGGAIAAAAKTGLLGKLIKPILVGLAVVGGVIVKFWNKITGRNQ